MARKRRPFKRQYTERRIKKLFVIATEGLKTEIQYFDSFNGNQTITQVKCLKGKQSAPSHVLKRMKDHLRAERFKNTDEAWLVVDKDQWNDQQLMQLFQWSKKAKNFGFALSNPKFELWLLLHFELGKGITTAKTCTERLMQHIPGYDKSIDMRKFTLEMMNDAIRRAKARDKPPCKDWPRSGGKTTVYKLVEKILQG